MAADSVGTARSVAGREPRSIEVLPDEVIDQIAAGEVVERPASVVKELVENALDAGARAITVEVDGGGRELVRVIDDGCGMSAAELRLALRRHATSKLRRVDDLFELGTMGFRGEALPSIAAVSRMLLRSRTAGELAATALRVEGGELVEQAEVGAPAGTLVEVRDLLWNVPARQKFLKGAATEAAHVTDAVTRLALAHPDVHFLLRHGGRTALDAPPHADRLERARALLGARAGAPLHRASGQEAGVHVEALLGAPELAQTTARGVQLYVGRRWVRDRGLLHALGMGYGELVPRGRYPVAVVFIDLPGASVDVNVHPQKLEVRFADAQAVYAAVRHIVGAGVAAAPWLTAAAPSAPVRMHAIASMAPPPRAAERPRPAWTRPRPLAEATLPLGPIAPPEGVAEAEPAPPAPSAVSDFFTALRYLGQLDRTYLVCEADGELVLVDQHAAHERVAFQRLRERWQERALPVQRLLFPETLALDPAHVAAAAESAAALAALGFEVEPFGEATLAVRAVPAGLRAGDGPAVLGELLDELADRGGSRALDERLDHVLATIACHSVVRAGDPLSPREADALLRSLDGVDFRAHCPHGRPVLLRIPVDELARRFGRT
ncbi:MAG TPA: DNA mismatch repair endonuclease MutL [Kofleriaceae bacterium]|nr:DNA mismatch repair endonuclease MutL [Kofleriaceae bacterium]